MDLHTPRRYVMDAYQDRARPPVWRRERWRLDSDALRVVAIRRIEVTRLAERERDPIGVNSEDRNADRIEEKSQARPPRLAVRRAGCGDCRVAGATLATHNVRDCEHCAIGVVGPWESSGRRQRVM